MYLIKLDVECDVEKVCLLAVGVTHVVAMKVFSTPLTGGFFQSQLSLSKESVLHYGYYMCCGAWIIKLIKVYKDKT